MKVRFSIGLWPQLFLVAAAIAILGIAPHPHAFRQSLRDAKAASDQDRPQRACEAAARAASLLPWRADLWEKAGVFAFQAGNNPEAIEYLKRAWRADQAHGLSATGWITLGDAYQRLDNLPEAVRAWSAGAGRYGATAENLSRLWQSHLLLGNYEAGIAHLKSLLALTPNDAALNYRLGLLLATQRPEDALQYLDRAAQSDAHYQAAAAGIRRAVVSARRVDDRSFLLLSTGRALAALNEWEPARESFRQAIFIRPEYAEAWAYLGEARQHAGVGTLRLVQSSTSDGLAELEIAHQLEPKSLSAHSFLALYWTRKANYEKALETLEGALRLDAKNPALQLQYAGLQALTGDLSGAYNTHLRAIELSPYEPAYRRYLVEFALEYDYQIEQNALPIARQLAARFPEQAENLELLGRVLIKTGDLDSAERFLQRAIKADPHFAPAHLHLGLVYALRGQREQALEELDLAIALASGTPTAAQAQRLLETYFP